VSVVTGWTWGRNAAIWGRPDSVNPARVADDVAPGLGASVIATLGISRRTCCWTCSRVTALLMNTVLLLPTMLTDWPPLTWMLVLLTNCCTAGAGRQTGARNGS
jgi:hypothetical protein